jgi:hypothetical protein
MEQIAMTKGMEHLGKSVESGLIMEMLVVLMRSVTPAGAGQGWLDEATWEDAEWQ